jgi:hypothetical protein
MVDMTTTHGLFQISLKHCRFSCLVSDKVELLEEIDTAVEVFVFVSSTAGFYLYLCTCRLVSVLVDQEYRTVGFSQSVSHLPLGLYPTADADAAGTGRDESSPPCNRALHHCSFRFRCVVERLYLRKKRNTPTLPFIVPSQ